jgi:hypothetical protein
MADNSESDSGSMKSGTGGFPDAPDEETNGTSEQDQSTGERPLGGIEETPVEEVDAVGEVPFENSEYPLLMARDNVKSSRDGKTIQIGAYQGTVDRGVQGEKIVDSALTDSLSTMDFKEAVYLAGLANLDDVCRILLTWGYDNDNSLFD